MTWISETVPVRSAYGAKYVSVTDGKITRSRFCARSSPLRLHGKGQADAQRRRAAFVMLG